MLDERERQAIFHLERRLAEEAPDLARLFRELGPARSQHWIGAIGVSAIIAMLILIIGRLVAGSPAAAAGLAGTVGLYWLIWRYSQGPGS